MKLSAHFSRSEFACGCGCGLDVVDVELITILEDLRGYFESPVTINSGARCPHHNLAVGGSPVSQHKVGKAADVIVTHVLPDVVAEYLERKYPDKYGIGRYPGRTHIDCRETKTRWSKK